MLTQFLLEETLGDNSIHGDLLRPHISISEIPYTHHSLFNGLLPNRYNLHLKQASEGFVRISLHVASLENGYPICVF